MRKSTLSFHYTTLALICQVLVLVGSLVSNSLSASATSLDTNNFEFKDFTADYYISRDSDGISHMHVHEVLTAVFPDYDQNHGITRFIPYTYGDGAVTTAASESALNLTVTRNGSPEPIAKSAKEDGAYVFNIGSVSTYVHGLQVYELDYDFENVVLSYTAAGNLTFNPDLTSHQELYWDTNGTGWAQPFEQLTATVHFEESLLENLTGETSCYVGKQGSNDLTRCTTTETTDGFSFTTQTLTSRENLTFDIVFKAGTFNVEPTYNYILVIFAVILAVLATLLIIWSYKKYASFKDKRDFYKNSPTPPEYLPLKGVSPAEAAKIIIGPTKPPKVATLIDLAVHHKIELIKDKRKPFGGYNWSIKVKDASNLSVQETLVLEILNGGSAPRTDITFEIKNKHYSSGIASLNTSYAANVKKNLKAAGLLEASQNSTSKQLFQSLSTVFIVLAIITFAPILFAGVADLFDSGGVLVGGQTLAIVDIILFFIMIFVPAYLSKDNQKYAQRTMKGLEAAIYFNGLKLYMEMAEKDRLKVLQSVEGADTSTAGIVKLYEKLLPYAVIFGIEDSWLNELNQYYEADETTAPTWYIGSGPITFSDLHNFASSINSSISSTTISSSSSSSGYSGGGGGGFSGGGGGGGGGGGW